MHGTNGDRKLWNMIELEYGFKTSSSMSPKDRLDPHIRISNHLFALEISLV